jgi:hypothetical protein
MLAEPLIDCKCLQVGPQRGRVLTLILLHDADVV